MKTVRQVTATLAMSVLCVGFLTTIITFIMFFTIIIENAHKERTAHLERIKTPLEEYQSQIDS